MVILLIILLDKPFCGEIKYISILSPTISYSVMIEKFEECQLHNGSYIFLNSFYCFVGKYNSHPDRFAVDFTSGNIFYTLVDIFGFGLGLGYSGVGVISPSGDHRLLIKYGEKPRDIVIDPSEGLVSLFILYLIN